MRSVSLRFRLMLLFIFIALFSGALLYTQARYMAQTHSRFEGAYQNEVLRLQIFQEIQQTAGQVADIPRVTAPADRQEMLTDITEQEKEITELRAKLGQANPEGAALTKYQEVMAQNDEMVREATTLLSTRNAEKARQVSAAAKANELEDRLDGAAATLQTYVQDQQQKEERELTRIQQAAALSAVGGMMAILMLVWLLERYLARVLRTLKGSAQRIANGDFSQTINIKSRDEVGELATSFNQMADRFKDSYRRLALEKQRDEALLENMGEGLVAIDEKGTIAMVNSNAVDLLELTSRDEAVGKELLSQVTLYDRKSKEIPKDQRPEQLVLTTATQQKDIFEFHLHNGVKILLYISASPIELNGTTVGAIIVLRDVTKEQEVDRMKTEFISLASHQLRTPLSAIKWFTEMLLGGDGGKLNDEQTEFAQNISDSTERMIELVNSLLNISRIESGRIIVDPQPTDLGKLVDGIVTELKPKTAEKEQTLIVSVHKDLPQINLDPRLVGQVYLNLLTNAIKYTPKGGEISVFISRKDDMVLSQVTDNGYGIPKSEHGKVFQKFFRADNVVKVETDGTGLGLYLIKAIVESSGGKIWFESEEGKGTTFWFTLPLAGMKAKEGEVTLDT